MEIRVPASLRKQVIATVREALAKDFPGAEIRIASFKSSAVRSALAADSSSTASIVRFHGTGSESTHKLGAQYPIGGGETFLFEGVWERAKGLVSLTLKKLANIYGASTGGA